MSFKSSHKNINQISTDIRKVKIELNNSDCQEFNDELDQTIEQIDGLQSKLATRAAQEEFEQSNEVTEQERGRVVEEKERVTAE